MSTFHLNINQVNSGHNDFIMSHEVWMCRTNSYNSYSVDSLKYSFFNFEGV